MKEETNLSKVVTVVRLSKDVDNLTAEELKESAMVTIAVKPTGHAPFKTLFSLHSNPAAPDPSTFSLWAEYAAQGHYPKTHIGKERYEWFVAGFLFFYASELRSNTEHYYLFFDWNDTAKTVRVLLSPPPRTNPDYDGVPTTGSKTDPPPPPPPPPPPLN